MARYEAESAIEKPVYRQHHWPGLLLAALGALISACHVPSRVTNPVDPDKVLQREAAEVASQTLPFHVGALLDIYLDEVEPVYFLVSTDLGHADYQACTEPPCYYDGRELLTRAYRDCERLRLGTECVLLYLRRHPLADGIEFKDSISYALLQGEQQVPPGEAHGKIIYLPGFSGWTYRGYNFPPSMQDSEISPMLMALEARGWDVDVLNMMHLDRSRSADVPEMTNRLVEKLVEEARRAGYRRVILYGGSYGGAEIINAAIAGVEADAITLMEPSWHGPRFTSRGEFNPNDRVRQAEIEAQLSRIPGGRIVFVYFRDSGWYGDISRPGIESSLDSSGADFLLLARPLDIVGHGGSWTYRFANVYSDCLHRFFIGEIDSTYDCRPAQVDESRRENWAVKSAITRGGFERLDSDEIRELVAEKGLCTYRPAEDSIRPDGCQLWEGNQRLRTFRNEFDLLIKTNDLIDWIDNGYCRHNSFARPTYFCFSIYRVEDDLLAEVPLEGESIRWYKLVDRDEVIEQHAESRYYCENTSKLRGGKCNEI